MRSGLPSAVRVETDVGELLLPAGDKLMAVGMDRDGVWEPEEGAVLRAEVEPGMAALNVGAHCGYFALMLSSLVGGGGEVVAVEAAPDNYALLVANLERAGAANVRTVNAAAWSRSGETLPLSLSDFNTGDHRTYAWDSGRQTLEVESIAIDDLDPPLERLDVVMLDTQATEHRVVEGMRRTLERFRPLMLVEYWPAGLRDLGDDPEGVIDSYRRLGYTLALAERPGEPLDGPASELVAMADRHITEYLNLVLRPA